MKRTLAFVAVLALCGQAVAAPVFGNDAGCGLSENAADSDSLIKVSPTEIEFWESGCDLPTTADYSGKPMTLSCWNDEGSDYLTFSLKKEGDTLIYSDDGHTETLYRCPQ